ncbi:protein FAR1-RELATED SEQUENCE 5 isoform X1 [Arachis duranensis]|uniref:Protein FAR1-RELATED SEQUENCE n=1 Tax=Arachis duranensis TaxID=130453 RepID=A0A6P4BVM0_ARADU|nr:protein FAR1-RELATED SEQUENCE 5 isoform X1 [Arachis duranensis]XP_020989822.1 protein FAR1-RELATED SEQUENCE 5 isoform X1 [Arachis duranensis]
MRHRNVPQSMDLEMEATGFESEEEEEEEDDEDDEEEQHPQTNNNYNNPSSSNSNPNSTTEPYIGMEFDSELSARAFYNAYARRIGFSTRVSVCLRSRKDSSVIRRRVVCSREGFRRNPENHDPKRHRSVTRVGCKAQITVKKKGPLGKWYISKFIKDHNHDLVPPDRVHCLRSHRRVNGAARSLIDTLHAAGMGAAEVMTVLIKESGGIDNVGFTKVDCQNYMTSSSKRSLGSGNQLVFDFLKKMSEEDPSGFFYSFQGDSESSSGNIFWADGNARRNYEYFGDAVVFDMAYRRGRYKVPFAPFTGWNHHGQPVLFGCALMLNESEASFVWLFTTWLQAMYGRHPVSITTDQDRIIHSAVLQVFPDTRHRFSKWDVFGEVQERLIDVCGVHPEFESEFRRCVNSAETVDEFESSWKFLVGRYELLDNEWLQLMYRNRHQWVPVYLRDTFFGDLSAIHGSDTSSSYFDGFINATTTVQTLIKQYEKGVADRYEKEVKEDYDTLNTAPVLRTPSPMEKQAAGLYTRKIFARFQEELVETLAYAATLMDDARSQATYRVAKYGEENRAHFVRFNVFRKKASCSCQMFEFAGLVCRHILAVFRVINILTLPSHYILKRWTRNAKSILLDKGARELQNSLEECYSSRYDSLSREIMSYVEMGAESSDTYSVALNGLREAAKKVADAKKPRPAPVQSTSDNNENHESSQSSDTDQDKKIQELTTELEGARQRCESYRQNLFGLLKNMEEQKLKISVKAQSVRLNLGSELVAEESK